MRNKNGLIFVYITLSLCLMVITLRLPHLKYRGFLSDEATYLAIAESLVFDKDIYYEPKDLIRIVENYPSGPQGIFLRKTIGNRLVYAKSIIYSLFASPFYAVFKERGFITFNVILFMLSSFLAWKWLMLIFRDSKPAIAISLVFFFCSVAFLYLFWMTPEIFNLSLVSMGIILFSYKLNYEKRQCADDQSPIEKFLLSKYSSTLASIFIALATCSKPPNIILTIPIGLFLLKDKKWKELFICATAFVLIIVIFFGSYYMLTGDWNFMGGERKTFYQRLPFDNPTSTFDILGVSHTAGNYWDEYHINFNIIANNLIYFFVGRFSGIFLYFPITLVILCSYIFAKKDKFSILIFILIIMQILGYTILIPHNYFGGGGTLGNRYFMNIYPLFLILIRSNFSMRKLLLTGLLAALFIGQMLMNVLYFSFYPFAHAKYFPYTIFPPEMTMVENLPTNVNYHAFRIALESSPKFYLYYLNDNFYVPERGGFWIPGKKEVEFIIEVGFKPSKIIFHIENGLANNNRITIKVNGQLVKAEFISGERKDLQIDASKSFFYTRNKWFYRVKIKSRKGYIPAFWHTDYRDRRFLGCFIKITVQ